MKRMFTMLCALTVMLSAGAQSVDTVRVWRYAGPYTVQRPAMIDSLNVNGVVYEDDAIDTHLRLGQVYDGQVVEADSLVLSAEEGESRLHLIAFDFINDTRCKVTVTLEGCSSREVYVDGDRVYGERMYDASRHHVIVKAATTDTPDTLIARVEGARACAADRDGKRRLTLLDLQCGERCHGGSLSPDGRYLKLSTYTTNTSGRTSYRTVVRDLATGRDVDVSSSGMTWMPRTNKYYFNRTSVDGRRQIIVKDPATLVEEVWADDIPSGDYRISPDEKYLLYTFYDSWQTRDSEVYEVIEPEDRQDGYRVRQRFALYDLATGMMRPLTHGHHDIYLSDISADGSRLLLLSLDRRLTERPTTLHTYIQLDINTMQLDTLILRDGFVSDAEYSPDGTQLIIKGSPDCLGGIGRNLPDSLIANEFDEQLYIMSLADRQIRPLTKHFNPSIESFAWSCYDNQIYVLAEDRDCQHIFSINPTSGAIQQLPTSEEYVSRFALSRGAPVLTYYGQGLNNTSRMYTVDLRRADRAIARHDASIYETLIEDFSARILHDVQLGEAHEWPFITSRGDTLANGYILPPDFDAERQYPMIVYYYGGTSPTSRTFDSTYPFHLYAAMGYVVLYVNPSGATGFGQEWSARHVNTAGEGVADDIIESAQQFCAQHGWVNASKVGCIGASYGGFMTQVLQTKTDFFAAAVSHAGISAYSSYWGEGYWGYSYSEAERAGSYPWNRRDLFVDRSPLFNADKIHTPLLFLHGTADTNVPIGESIQMFTALKLLGRETAFVAIEDENHWVQDFEKRQKWQATIFAWFARWLQDDDSWWTEMYGDKSNL